MNNSDSYYLENILSNIPEYVFWKDLNSTYVRCNKNFANLAGLDSIDGIVGKTDFDLPWAQFTKEVYLEEDRQIIETKLPMPPKAVPLTGADGIYRVIRVSKAPLIDKHDNVIGILGVFHDITELSETQSALLEQMEKTEEAYRSKTEFLSITTHEVRNPVGNITMFDSFLKRNLEELNKLFSDEIVDVLKSNKKEKIISKYNELFNKATENIGIIAHEAEKTLDYLKCLGEIHRFQATGITSRFVSIKTENLLKGIIKDTSAYNIHNAEITASIDIAVPKRVEIDYSNIYEASKVILSNALRFSHIKDIVKVQITDENAKLKITVKDCGIGIATSQISDLFGDNQDFVQDPEAALYRKPSLRLTLAKMMVEASGGELKIEKADKGTLVTILAPYKPIADILNNKGKSSIKITATDEGLLQEKEFAKRKILIIEDDPLFQKAEKFILEELGHIVSIAPTGKDALKKLSQNTYDIVFLDITLPDLSGVEVMREIRKNNQELRIIVVTSHANTIDIEHFEEMGATLVLTKPVSREQFQNCLEFSEDEND
jgi:two-component system aerobic respiration control sensor histidine kinase ArcB